MSETQVLIVGAGPTGLVLALFLARAGVKFRIIEKNSGPGQASRAMAVQARTLEFYRQLGFADDVVRHGIPIDTIQVRSQGNAVAQINIHDFGEGLSPYPFVLSYPQDDHERLLVERLRTAGIEVEWETELTDLRESGDDVHAFLRKKDGTSEECVASYLCGCDGAHSAVRQNRGIGFPGGAYAKTFFVADVKATGEAAAHQSLSFCINGHDFMLVLPVRSTGMNRLIGVIPEELSDGEHLTFDEIRPFAEKTGGIHVDTVNWFSTYRVHHRVAEHFRAGRMFLCGDAGHIHSPVGGQGMNTGIGDSVNLSWKLAAVLQGRADASILDTYEQERIAFARALVATTDRLFQLMTGSGVGNQLFRETVFPHFVPFALGFSSVRTAAFRMASQTRISYRESALSDGVAGEIHGGDRLPWVRPADASDNFAPLQSVDWQVHVYGEAGQAIREAASAASFALHEFDWTASTEKAGLMRDALYLVRPDGYVGLAADRQDAATFHRYLSRFNVVPAGVAARVPTQANPAFG